MASFRTWRSAVATVALMAALVSGVAGPAEARNRALLVGVSNYTGTGNSILKNLYGPANDVTQMWRYFRSAGFDGEDITVLADLGENAGKDGKFPLPAAPPTYRAIIAELQRLAAQDYAAGDVVVIYYSGHGTTEPDNNPGAEPDPEADGRDQVLLPADAGHFTWDTKTIENGLVDDELGTYITRIRGKGATVWAIIDACNSGSATRGGELVSRGVDPALLGVPDGPPSEARGSSQRGLIDYTRTGTSPPGALIGFYAVDELHKAFEKNYPFTAYQEPIIGSNALERRMGIFTYHLLQALQSGGSATFQDLIQDTASRMALDQHIVAIPRPFADGSLSLPVPWRQQADAPRLRARLDNGALMIASGWLAGFAKGAVVTLYGEGKDGQPIAEAILDSDSPVSSAASSVQWLNGHQPEASGVFPVRLTGPVASAAYRVALPDVAGLAPDAPAVKVRTLLQKMFAAPEGQALYGVELVPPGDPLAQLAVLVEDNAVWLAKSGEAIIKDPQAFGKTLSIDLAVMGTGDEGDKESPLRDAIWRLAKAERLLRVASVLESGTKDRSDLAVSVGRFRVGKRAMPPREACPARKPASLTDAERTMLVDQTNTLAMSIGNCDIVELTVTGFFSDNDYFVGAFYLDSRGGVYLLRSASDPLGACGYSLPMGAKQGLRFDVQIQTLMDKRLSTTGLEHIVLLAVARRPDAAMPQFCNLAQNTLADVRSSRGEETAVQSLFDAINGGTRGRKFMVARKDGVALGALTFAIDLDVRP